MKRLAVVLLAACGGSATNAPPRATPREEPKESIADAVAAQGGLAALGGAGNREEGSTGAEVAMSGALHADEIDKKAPVKMDGDLREWPARVAGDALRGSPQGVAFDIGVQYDADKIYLASDITSSKLTRSGKRTDADEHMSATIAFPSGRGALAAYEIGVWPGKAGDFGGVVRWLSGANRGQEVAGARVLERESHDGVTMEIALPWASFPEARTTRVGLRAAFRWHDRTGVVGTGPGDAESPADLAPLPTHPEQAVVDGLLVQMGLAGKAPKIDLYVDVTGDGMKERISVFGKFFTICGPTYRKGRQFFWREIAGSIVSLEARPVMGRPGAKDDLVVRRRVKTGATHETVEVWTFPKDEPVTAFAAEVLVASADGKKLTNAARIGDRVIDLAVEPAVGFTEASFQGVEGAPPEVEAILTPWGAVQARSFKIDKGKVVMADETRVPPAASASIAAPATAAAKATGSQPTAKPATTDNQAIAAYLRDVGATSEPTRLRFDVDANVDGDARPERIVLIGRDIVIVGAGFKSGTGYAKVTLSQLQESDVRDVAVRDLTGDGAGEIIVTGTRHMQASDGPRTDVDAMFVYRVKNGVVARVFAIETSRSIGESSLTAPIAFADKAIEVKPAIAKGWTEKTYPWRAEEPGGVIEPLILPWATRAAPRRYVWTGATFSAK